jgi:hypothetical protein
MAASGEACTPAAQILVRAAMRRSPSGLVTGSDHREGQVRRSLGRVGGQLGHLKGAEDMAAEMTSVLQRLQAGREHRPFVMTEVGVRAPGRDHQAVVAQHQLLAVRGQGMHDLAVQIQVLHVGQHHARVGQS